MEEFILNLNRKWTDCIYTNDFKEKHITLKQLSKRKNWTYDLVKKFLGDPDYLGNTIKNDKCYTVKFYLVSRVYEVEAMNCFREAVLG